MEERFIAKIGKLMDKKDIDEPYQEFVHNMYPNTNYKMVVFFFNVIENNNTGKFSIEYDKIDIEDVGANTNSYRKYCYREGSANGGDITFTTKAGDIYKKLSTSQKICDRFINKANDYDNLQEEYKIFSALKEYLNNSKNLSFLKEKFDSFLLGMNKNENKIGITFALNFRNKTLYMKDFETVKSILLYEGDEGKTEKYNVKSKGSNETCSICLQKKEKLLGFASPFKYYTLDKVIFASNFFKKELSWKNYPICFDCSKDLEKGKVFLESNLKRNFYGISYFLIPHTIIDNDELYIKAYTYIKNYAQAKNEQDNLEDHFMQYIANEGNYFNLDLIFFKKDTTTKAIDLLLYIEEIFPSRFKTLFVDVPNKINNNPIFHQCYKDKKEIKDLKFSTQMIKQFFQESFLDLINNIFRGISLDTKLLYHYFMRNIRKNYNESQTEGRNTEPLYLIVYKAIMVYLYLNELGIIATNNGDKFMINIENENQQEYKSAFDMQKLQDFINNNSPFFDKNYKIVLFCLGILIRAVLNIQYSNLGNTPFEKKLRGYNISPYLIKQLYLEVLDKLSQYQSFYSYNNLREFIAQNFVSTEKEIEMLTNNEISFYLVTGIELGNKFKTNKEENNE